MRELTPAGTKVLVSVEGDIGYVYDDSKYPTKKYAKSHGVPGGTLTGGVGHTGPDLIPWIGKDIPQTVRDKWLDEDTDATERAVNRLVKVNLAPHQWDTLYLFTFNIGIAAFEGSTLLKKVNAGQLDAVPAELAKWTKTTIHGKRVQSPGLKIRRAKEAILWNGGKVAVIPAEAPNSKLAHPSGTQVAERTPTKISPTEIVTSAVAIGTPASAFATSTGWVAVAFAGVVLVVVVVLGAIAFKRYVLNK